MYRFTIHSLSCGMALGVALMLMAVPVKADASLPDPSLKVVSPEFGAPVLPGFADLVEHLLPAVVNISVSAVIHPEDGREKDGPDSSSPDGPQTPIFPPGSPLEKFFHDYTEHKHGQDAPTRQVQALGSGFIIDPSGVIVTNDHVIDKAKKITVTLHDGREMLARIVGRDSKVDLAVLQVKPMHPLPFVSWGKSDQARIGDWVLAIGNPLGLSGTVTAGIISSRKRNVEHGLYDDFIQTDAAINRGNSGGPLFNVKGEVIGINTLIYGGAGGGSIGLGFSIPSDDARGLVEQMRRTGHVTRGWLGIGFQNVTCSMAEALNYKDNDGQLLKGAILAEVKKGGPAAVAGLEVGDIFKYIENQPVTGYTLARLVAEHQPGEKVTAQVWHKGAVRTVTLIVGHAPEEPDPFPSDTHPPLHSTQMVEGLGLKVGIIDADARMQYNLSDSQRGVLVIRVFEGGLAANHGLAEGNVITQVGDSEVNTPDAFLKAIQRVREIKRGAVLLLVQGKDGVNWVPLPLTAP